MQTPLLVQSQLYSNCIKTDTGRPPFTAGTNLICRAAAIARSVSPNGNVWTARIWTTSPLLAKTTRNITVPSIAFRRASSVYCGSGLNSTRARCSTCEPLNGCPLSPSSDPPPTPQQPGCLEPPPMFPFSPGPTPGPSPTPIPVPRFVPIPSPLPGPLDSISDFDLGSP